MKFLCLGYFDPTRMDTRPKDEIESVMRECQPHLDALYATGQVVFDAGVGVQSTCLRRVDGALSVTEAPFVDSTLRIGCAFLIEANDLDEAIRIASLHPTTQIRAGEELGWGVEIRPIHYFENEPTA